MSLLRRFGLTAAALLTLMELGGCIVAAPPPQPYYAAPVGYYAAPGYYYPHAGYHGYYHYR